MDKMKKLELLQQPELGILHYSSPQEATAVMTKALRRSKRDKNKSDLVVEESWDSPWEDEQKKEESNATLPKDILGTWYLINVGGDIFVTKEKPKGKEEYFRIPGDISGYMQLTRKEYKFENCKFPISSWSLCSRDFNKLKLPEVTEENSPLEIEIMKSGNVYYYES